MTPDPEVGKITSFSTRLVAMFAIFVATTLSCIDRLDFDVPEENFRSLVVDGLITDRPGPYYVRLARSIKIDGLQVVGQPISAKAVTLIDNLGNEEEMTETETGTYATRIDGMQGVIGHEYKIRILLLDGRTFESPYDRLNRVGELEGIEAKFESFLAIDGSTSYRYKVLASGKLSMEENVFTRWRLSGTYVVSTLPQLYMDTECYEPPCGCRKPLPCSNYAIVNGELRLGYKIDPITREPVFQPGLTCECCRCWVTESEYTPTVQGNKQHSNAAYHDLFIGEVPITYYRFQEKYRVTVEQMSLSKNAYEYWQAVESQKQANASLFQPISGRIPVSIREKNGSGTMLGLFYASAISRKQIFLDKSTHFVFIPEPISCTGRVGPMAQSCLTFPGSTTTRPGDWVD